MTGHLQVQNKYKTFLVISSLENHCVIPFSKILILLLAQMEGEGKALSMFTFSETLSLILTRSNQVNSICVPIAMSISVIALLTLVETAYLINYALKL